jgi:predicted transcriptional regulator YdeE
MTIVKSFKIIGISVRTTNQNNKSAQDIGLLWKQFFNQQLSDKIPNKTSNHIYSIYTDYKSNFTEDYTTIIGLQVNSLEVIPEGLIGREFHTDTFTKFIAKGQMPKAIIDLWANIWQQDNELNRKYSYDFELYGNKCQNGDNSEVEIYIATKS